MCRVLINRVVAYHVDSFRFVSGGVVSCRVVSCRVVSCRVVSRRVMLSRGLSLCRVAAGRVSASFRFLFCCSQSSCSFVFPCLFVLLSLLSICFLLATSRSL